MRFLPFIYIPSFFFCLSLFSLSAQMPTLPEGLADATSSDSSMPALPLGMGGSEQTESKELEGQNSIDARDYSFWKRSLDDWHGFIDARLGYRYEDPVFQNGGSLREVRLNFKRTWRWQDTSLKWSQDILADDLAASSRVDLERGNGWLDLRELYVSYSIISSIDLKLGRQIATWGTGDLLFINDLHPKDWNSFLLGREDSYLKAPSDALRLSYYGDWINVDFLVSPEFNPDRFIDGSRVSFYSSQLATVVGQNAMIDAEIPENPEYHLRLFKTFGSQELALYGYRGFWKSPSGFDPISGKALFNELRVYGGSLRGPLVKGIYNIEFGLYDSREDATGTNALVRNSEWRILLGYEQELWTDLTIAFQFYEEHMQDYDNWVQSVGGTEFATSVDRKRQVFTFRLTQILMMQDLHLSLFAFYSPTDEDYFLRPQFTYKVDDHWQLMGGAQIFGGEFSNTFYAQFESNSSIYLGLRYGF